MVLTTKIVIDMRDKYVNTIIDAVQYDKNSRIVEATLLSGGTALSIPTDSTYKVNFRRSDGASGSYDKLSDGSAAVQRSGSNGLKIGIHELVTNVSGKSLISVRIMDGTSEINTFSFVVNVQESVTEGSSLNKKYPDTYDGTAISSDIEEGKTAYSHGEKITGTLKKATQLSNSATDIRKHGIANVLYVDASPNGKFIVDQETVMRVSVGLEEFGDAMASDVANGKSFTSAAGLKVAGTLPVVENMTRQTYTGCNVIMNDNDIDVYKHMDQDVLLRTGAVVHMIADGERFGDATASDVFEGKTFTSASGLKVVGTHKFEEGIDTSDATATAADIAWKKTAYVNGKKVTGEISESPYNTMATPHVNGPYGEAALCLEIAPQTDRIVRVGTVWTASCPLSALGNATAADVAKGVFFTSREGFMKEGQAEFGTGGGGFSVTDDGNGNVVITSASVTDNNGNVIIA
jgi:hypothetical protein